MDQSNWPGMPGWPLVLLVYVILAVSLWKMAERVKDESPWFAFVPVLNLVLLVKLAMKPLWWVILLFIPFVNIVVFIIVTMGLCARFGINKWWGLVGVITPFNLILFLYLAFGTGAKEATPPQGTASSLDGVSRLAAVTAMKAAAANDDAMQPTQPKPPTQPPPPPPPPKPMPPATPT